jgi:hypothetical protein
LCLKLAKGRAVTLQRRGGTESEVNMSKGPPTAAEEGGIEETGSHEEPMLLQRVPQGVGRGADMTERVFEVRLGAFEVY